MTAAAPLDSGHALEIARALVGLEGSGLGSLRSWATPGGRSPQGEFLQAFAQPGVRAVVFRSGNQVGKSTVGAASLVRAACGWHWWCRFDPPIEAWVSALSWDVLADVLWPRIKPLLPRAQLLPGAAGIGYHRQRPKEVPAIVRFKNGSLIRFFSAERGAGKYQGGTIHYAWVDEEQPPDVIEELKMRLVRHAGYLVVTLTPVQRMRWVQDLERRPDTRVVRASIGEAVEAGLLSPEALTDLADLPERQRLVRGFGEFVALEGLVYPEFLRSTHVARVETGHVVIGSDRIAPWPLPADWERYAAVDWGFNNPAAWLLAARDPVSGRVLVYRCWYGSGRRPAEWASAMVERLPELHAPVAAEHDPAANEDLRQAGIPWRLADKADASRNRERVARWLARRLDDGHPQLMLVADHHVDRELGRDDAERVAWEIEGYHYPAPSVRASTDPRDAPVKAHDHACDTLGYLLPEVERCAGRRSAGAEAELRMGGAGGLRLDGR